MDKIKKLASQDLLARFLVSSNHFSRTKDRVKSSAFMPAQNLTLSVFQIKGLPKGKIWMIGKKYVSQPREKTLYGHADIFVGNVLKTGLKIYPTDDPPRHANITDWPEDKSEQKLLALELSLKAVLILA